MQRGPGRGEMRVGSVMRGWDGVGEGWRVSEFQGEWFARGGFVLADGESKRLEGYAESHAALSPLEEKASWTRGVLRLWLRNHGYVHVAIIVSICQSGNLRGVIMSLWNVCLELWYVFLH